MTVPAKVKQCIASLKSANASLETFALDTENRAVKQLFQSAASQTRSITDSLESRLREIESQEPQYKQTQS